ncbi:MAG: hypothetical protein C5B59_10195 [Bacteroidetes bacterium]|nr:MAG: hypothetical protein C5B59_10195 [Bacteroidota bacterium]
MEENYTVFYSGPFLFMMLLIGVVMIAAYWRIFAKAGRPGWAAIIPIYNVLVLLKVVGKPWWWLLLFLIPVVDVIFAVWTINMLSKSFGKGVGFTVGLLLLGIIFYPILGFGSAKYLGPYGDPGKFKAAQNP